MSANQQVLAGIGKPKFQEEFTVPGTYFFYVPAGVTSISVVAIGAGGVASDIYTGGGGGGALSYVNNVAVTPGEMLTVTVGIYAYYLSGLGLYNGTDSLVKRGEYVLCRASAAVGYSGGVGGVGTVFAGGNSRLGSSDARSGGGGAGGYAGNGGYGGYDTTGYSSTASSGVGGAGGGGLNGGGGGGTGIYGQGANGAAGEYYGNLGGGGGSNGQGGGSFNASSPNRGGEYGGGAGNLYNNYVQSGGGAVRIIWPGNLRQFPSTRTADE